MFETRGAVYATALGYLAAILIQLFVIKNMQVTGSCCLAKKLIDRNFCRIDVGSNRISLSIIIIIPFSCIKVSIYSHHYRMCGSWSDASIFI